MFWTSRRQKILDPVGGHTPQGVKILFDDQEVNGLSEWKISVWNGGNVAISKADFLIADASWYRKSVEKNILPNPIVRLFFHSWKDFKNSLEKIHQFYQKNPEVEIVPTHCFDTTSKLIKDKISFDVL